MINNYKILVSVLIFVLTVSGCQKSPPDKQVIEKAKFRVNAILDSLRNENNMIIESSSVSEEFFDDRQDQYVINYIIYTGLDSSSVIETTASLFIIQENDDWFYNFSFNEPYRGKLTNN